MYEENFNIKRKDIITISPTSIISAIIIYVIGFLKIDSYLSNIIIPFFIMLISYIFIVKTIKLEKNKKAYWF